MQHASVQPYFTKKLIFELNHQLRLNCSYSGEKSLGILRPNRVIIYYLFDRHRLGFRVHHLQMFHFQFWKIILSMNLVCSVYRPFDNPFDSHKLRLWSFLYFTPFFYRTFNHCPCMLPLQAPTFQTLPLYAAFTSSDISIIAPVGCLLKLWHFGWCLFQSAIASRCALQQ